MSNKPEKVVVTRHKCIMQYLLNKGLIDKNTKHLSFAKPEDIQGKHVFGILPNWLACQTAKFTELHLRLPVELRGRDLTLAQIETYIVEPVTYIIRREK